MEELIVRGLPLKVWSNSSLVHRVLLTDPSELEQVTWSGQPRVNPTPSFTDFIKFLRPPSETSDQQITIIDVENVVKGAFVDGLCRSIHLTSDIRPVQDLLLKLHIQIRNLVPSRHDLHSILNDEAIQKSKNLDELFTSLKYAARALEQLESLERAVSTNDWIRMVENSTSHGMTVADEEKKDEHFHSPVAENWPRFLIESIFYLLYKCDLCEADKLDFFLSTVWAPRIHQEGTLMERMYFLKNFGMTTSSTAFQSAPKTVAFLRSLVGKSENPRQLLHDKDARLNLIRNGWIDEIVFRSSENSLELPEVFSLDADSIHRIRDATRFGVAICALALHSCKSAHQSTEILSSKMDTNEQKAILAAVKQQQLLGTQQLYEQHVADVVISVANAWNESGNGIDETSLRGQTMAVLRGKDPVLQLLTARMQTCFREIVQQSSTNDMTIPLIMKSGHDLFGRESGSKMSVTGDTKILHVNLFCKRGLCFCASDIAKAADLARKIVNLMWSNYGTWMDRILIDECSRCMRRSG